MPTSIFERIIKREIPSEIVFENSDVVAFRDVNPQAPVHVLVVPKRRIDTLDDLVEEDLEIAGKLVLAATRVARELGLSENGYRLVINCREAGGQSVDHIHVHLLGGRQMKWPPG